MDVWRALTKVTNTAALMGPSVCKWVWTVFHYPGQDSAAFSHE